MAQKMGGKSKEIQWKKKHLISFIIIAHKTEKSDRSSLQGVGTEQEKEH